MKYIADLKAKIAEAEENEAMYRSAYKQVEQENIKKDAEIAQLKKTWDKTIGTP